MSSLNTVKNKLCLLSGNTLKFIAAAAMLIDHVGILFFPDLPILRIIGRISLPIFSFMVAEGCRYTKNKLRYFLSVFSLALICQTVYFLHDGSLEMCILVTFSLAILAVYALQNFKDCIFSPDCSRAQKLIAALLFFLSIAAICFINIFLDIDYGFGGCMLPLFASLTQAPKNSANARIRELDCIPIRVLVMGIGLVFLSIASGGRQWFSLLALPLLLLYSGKRGSLKTKYFFYVFYPSHLVLLESISMLIG